MTLMIDVLVGSMIIIASTAGLRPGGSSMAYCASYKNRINQFLHTDGHMQPCPNLQLYIWPNA
jgi:hypothetical protein